MSFEEDFDLFTGSGEGSYLSIVKGILDQANLKLVRDAVTLHGGEEPDGIWEVYDEMMAPDFTLSAPDGCVIELDGRCAHNYVSPVRGSGMILWSSRRA